MLKARGLQVTFGAFVTSALFAACAPDLKTSTGDGGAGSWAESSSASSSSSSSQSSSSGESSSSSSSSSGSSSSSSGMPNPTCVDLAKNGNETDIDCGGPMCPACGAGQKCFTDSDCTSGICGANDICAPVPNCMDNIKNGKETDIDCGGSDCVPCTNGYECLVNSDCQSGACVGGGCTNPPVFIGATVLDVQNSFTMPLPNGVQTNDLLLMFVAHGGGTLTVVPPSGWTTIEDGSNPGSDPKTDIYYKIYDVATSLNFSMVNSDGSAILAAFRGVSYGGKGTLNNSSTDTITTSQMSTLIFVSLQNGSGETPAIPPGFTSAGLGNGNMRSIRVAYSTNQPAGMYTLTPVVLAGELLPSASLGIALY